MSEPAKSDPLQQRLEKAALAACNAAYAPYSGYHVGCALSAGGQVFEGANVENASHGLTICAERNTVARAVIAGQRELDLVVVATASSPPAAPCGMCLQTFGEFTTEPQRLRIILINASGERREFTLKDLLPHGFRKEQLPPPRGGGDG